MGGYGWVVMGGWLWVGGYDYGMVRFRVMRVQESTAHSDEIENHNHSYALP